MTKDTTQMSESTESLYYTVVKPPTPFTVTGKSVFLAGSTEMGKAPDWQAELTAALFSRMQGHPSSSSQTLTVFNPRCDDWDSTWKQSIHDPKFKAQVDWELAAQEVATVIAMNLDGRTEGVISLLEMGLRARSGRMVICCDEGFRRRGYVELVCSRFGIKLCEDLKELEDEVVRMLQAA